MGREIENSIIASCKKGQKATIPNYEELIRELLFLAQAHGAVPFCPGYDDHPQRWQLQLFPPAVKKYLFPVVSGVWDPYVGRCYREVAETYYETSIFTVSDPFELYRRIRRAEQTVGFFARKLSTEHYTVRMFNAVSDRRGIAARACGHHNNFFRTRRLFERIFFWKRKDENAWRKQAVGLFSPTAHDLMSAWTVLLPLRGAGKIGSDAGQTSVPFQISERADFISHLMGADTRGDRPILNSRDEPHADSTRFSRIHMINGEGYRFPWTAFFDIGLTALLLAALDDDAFRLPWILQNPVVSLLQISRDLDFRTKIPVIVRSNDAVEERQPLSLLREVLGELEGYVAWSHLPSWCDTILGEAIATVDQLAIGEFFRAERMIDWVIKKRFLEDVMREKFGLNPEKENSWFHPRVRAMDLDHHRLDDGRLLEAEAAQCEVRDWETYCAPYGIPEQDSFWNTGAPHDTRSYLYWFLTTHPEWSTRTTILDWNRIEIRNDHSKKAAVIRIEDPRKFGRSHLLLLIQREKLDFSQSACRQRFIELLTEHAERRNEPPPREVSGGIWEHRRRASH